MDIRATNVRFWVPPKTHPDFKIRITDATGQHMLETLERIFIELDEMGVQADTVTCPHVDDVRGIGTLTYMGRTLDFCNDCYDLVVTEMRGMNDSLKTPAECREKARQFVNRASSPGAMLA